MTAAAEAERFHTLRSCSGSRSLKHHIQRCIRWTAQIRHSRRTLHIELEVVSCRSDCWMRPSLYERRIAAVDTESRLAEAVEDLRHSVRPSAGLDYYRNFVETREIRLDCSHCSDHFEVCACHLT